MNVAVTLPDKECRGHSFLEEGLVVAAAADLAAAKCDAEVFRSRARDVGQSGRIIGDGEPGATAGAHHVQIDIRLRLFEREKWVLDVIARTYQARFFRGPGRENERTLGADIVPGKELRQRDDIGAAGCVVVCPLEHEAVRVGADMIVVPPDDYVLTAERRVRA